MTTMWDFIYDNASTSASDTGTDGSPIDGDAAADTLADVVSAAKKVLDKNDVPEENRWLLHHLNSLNN